MNDHLSDMLARIKNAYKVGKKSLSMPHTKLIEMVGKVLLEEKYLSDLKVEGDLKKTITFVLNYVNGAPVLSSAKMVSKPGVRIYQKAKDIRPILSGLGISILSTSHGVMSNKAAKKSQLGGEVLMELW